MDHVYKTVELTGSSPESMEEAIIHAIFSKASQTHRNMRWFQLTETRGMIDEGKVAYWQVTMKMGFTLEDKTCYPLGGWGLILIQ